MLLDQLSELNSPRLSTVNQTIEDLSAEREPSEPPAPLTGTVRIALDHAFRHRKVELIIQDLEAFAQAEDQDVNQWATDTLATLHMRSPTSLKVALEAIRRGKVMSLLQALEMELRIATAFCVCISPHYFSKWLLTSFLIFAVARCQSRFHHRCPGRHC